MYVHRGNAVTALARDGGVVVVDIECVPLNGAQLAEDVVSHLSSAPGAILVACKLVLQQQHAVVEEWHDNLAGLLNWPTGRAC